MAKPQVRLDRKVASLLAKSAKANMRSVPKEANRLLLEVLESNDRSRSVALVEAAK